MQDIQLTRYHQSQGFQSSPQWTGLGQAAWPQCFPPQGPVASPQMYAQYPQYRQSTHAVQQMYTHPAYAQVPNNEPYLQEYLPQQECNVGSTVMRCTFQREIWTKTVETNEVILNTVPSYCVVPMALQRSSTAVSRDMQLYYEEQRQLEQGTEAIASGSRRQPQASRNRQAYAYAASRTTETRKSAYKKAKPTQNVTPEMDEISCRTAESQRRSKRLPREESEGTSSKQYRPEPPLAKQQIDPTVGRTNRRNNTGPNYTKTSRNYLKQNDEDVRIGKRRKNLTCSRCSLTFSGSEALIKHKCDAKEHEKRENHGKANRKMEGRKENQYDSSYSLSDEDQVAGEGIRTKPVEEYDLTTSDITDASGDEVVLAGTNRGEEEDSLDDGGDASNEESDEDYVNVPHKKSTRSSSPERTTSRYAQTDTSHARPKKSNAKVGKSADTSRYSLHSGAPTNANAELASVSNNIGTENTWSTSKRPQEAGSCQSAAKRRHVQSPTKLNGGPPKRSNRRKY